MPNSQVNRPPLWFWIVSVLATLWNAAGVWAYLAQVTMSPEALEALPEAERALHLATPAWAVGAFAIAVFGGLLGCLALLVRRRMALPLLVISLLAVLVQMGHAFGMSDALEVMGPQALIGPIVVILIGIGLVALAVTGGRRGWLR